MQEVWVQSHLAQADPKAAATRRTCPVNSGFTPPSGSRPTGAASRPHAEVAQRSIAGRRGREFKSRLPLQFEEAMQRRAACPPFVFGRPITTSSQTRPQQPCPLPSNRSIHAGTRDRISPEEFARAQDGVLKRCRRPKCRASGRKVPRKIRERVRAGAIVDRRSVVPEKYAEAVKEHSIDPIARPEMEFLPEEDGQPMRFKALVAVRPPIDPPAYDGLEITDVSEKAGDDDLTRALETMRRDAATLIPADRPVKLGDSATIDYAGKIDGVAFDGGTATGQQAEIAEERFIPGFASGIVGMAAGETRDISVKFPDDYGQTDLAGKDATFIITVHEIKEPELPVLDDEFAKRVSQNETLEALTTELATGSTRSRRKGAPPMSTELLERLAEVRPSRRAGAGRERDRQSAERTWQYVARMGLGWDDYLKNTERPRKDRNDSARAERRASTSLLIEEIAKRRRSRRRPTSVQLEALARQYGQPEERSQPAGATWGRWWTESCAPRPSTT